MAKEKSKSMETDANWSMKCMTYLLTKDGKQSGNERQASDMQDNRSSNASCCLHESRPLELLYTPVF